MRNPKQVTEAAGAVLSMDDAGAQVLADVRGVTPEQLRKEALGTLREQSQGGDVGAARLLLEHTEGLVLGQIARCRTAEAVLRRGLRSYGAGLLSTAGMKVVIEAAKLRRVFHHDRVSQRLDEVEGALVERVDG